MNAMLDGHSIFLIALLTMEEKIAWVRCPQMTLKEL